MNVENLTAGFLNVLAAPGPHPSLGGHAATYGRLIGSWAGEYEDRDRDGRLHTGPMEVHFAWVLEGRAVQDIWIALPRNVQQQAASLNERDTYGTTLRVFDATTETWRVVWVNPPTGVRNDLVGRRIGDDIVQTGYFRDTPIKWVFTDIRRESFVWRGFLLDADGTTWRLETEFKLRRTA